MLQDAIRDYAKAMSWYKKANLKGGAQAQLNIGELYYNGQGVKQDYSQTRWANLLKHSP